MEKSFSKVKDVDKKILSNLDDKDLLQVLLVSKYANSLLDDNFWRQRLYLKHPEISKYYNVKQTWKQYYLSSLYYIDRINRLIPLLPNYVQQGYMDELKKDINPISKYGFIKKLIITYLGVGSINQVELIENNFDDILLEQTWLK